MTPASHNDSIKKGGHEGRPFAAIPDLPNAPKDTSMHPGYFLVSILSGY
jgi:hypothetical protein